MIEVYYNTVSRVYRGRAHRCTSDRRHWHSDSPKCGLVLLGYLLRATQTAPYERNRCCPFDCGHAGAACRLPASRRQFRTGRFAARFFFGYTLFTRGTTLELAALLARTALCFTFRLIEPPLFVA